MIQNKTQIKLKQTKTNNKNNITATEYSSNRSRYGHIVVIVTAVATEE